MTASAPTATSANVMEDLRRDLVGAARDLCCRILDNLIEKCEKMTTTPSTDPTSPSGEGAFEGDHDHDVSKTKVVSPEEVVNASIVLREDKILDLLAKKEREKKKSTEELKEAKRMLEEEAARWEERSRERMALRNELETAR